MSRADRMFARNRWRAWKKARRRARRRGEVFDRDRAVEVAHDRAVAIAKKSRSPWRRALAALARPFKRRGAA